MGDTDEAMRTIADRLPLVAASARRTLELIAMPEHLPGGTTRWTMPSRSVTLSTTASIAESMRTLRLDVLSPGIGARIVIDLLPLGSPLVGATDPATVVELTLAAATSALVDPNHDDFDDDAHRTALRTGGARGVPDQRWHVIEGTPLHGIGYCQSMETEATADLPPTGKPMLVVGPGARLPFDDVPKDDRGRRTPHVLMRVSRRQRGVDLSELDPVAALRLLADDDDREAA